MNHLRKNKHDFTYTPHHTKIPIGTIQDNKTEHQKNKIPITMTKES